VACFGSSLFAVTTADGMIATSANGTSGWTYQSAPDGVQAPWILHDGTNFVLFSVFAQKCWTTTDFSTYTEKTGVSGITTLNRAKFVNGRYFLCHATGLIQSTDLVTWSAVNTGIAGQLFDIAWTGTNYVVAGTGTPRVRISSDLSSWSTPTGLANTGFYSCESDGAGNVVVQIGTSPGAQRSTDHGATFADVATTISGSVTQTRSLAYLNSNWFLAAADTIWTSTDGNNWTQFLTSSGIAETTGGGFAYDGTTYINGVSASSSNIVRSATSPSGAWTTRIGPSNLTAAAGGSGGDGGRAGGGGGGGGSVGANSGAGGAGGNGFVRVYSW
jgi:hypothetical protein